MSQNRKVEQPILETPLRVSLGGRMIFSPNSKKSQQQRLFGPCSLARDPVPEKQTWLSEDAQHECGGLEAAHLSQSECFEQCRGTASIRRTDTLRCHFARCMANRKVLKLRNLAWSHPAVQRISEDWFQQGHPFSFPSI